MKRLIFSLVTLSALFLIVALQGSAAGPANVVCSQQTNSFTGSAHNLIVPANGYCEIDSATITNDLIVEHDAGADVSNSTIQDDMIMQLHAGGSLATSTVGHDVRVGFGGGFNMALATIVHDLVASQSDVVGTGGIGPPPAPAGPSTVGHDFVINGSPGRPDTSNFIFNGICDLTVGNDLKVTNRWVTLGFSIGDEEACGTNAPVSVGHDLVVTNDSALSGFFGPSSLDVGNNTVGHDLIFTDNTAVSGGNLEVSDNNVGNDAVCARNNPAPSADDPGDGPNVAGGTNTCG